MSTTARPVTQVALTEVNSATAGLAEPGPARIIGSISSSVPRPHRTAKDTVMERAGERRAIRACLALRAGKDLGVAVPGRGSGRWEELGGLGPCLVLTSGPEHPAPRLVAGPTQDHVARLFTRGAAMPVMARLPRAVGQRAGTTVGG